MGGSLTFSEYTMALAEPAPASTEVTRQNGSQDTADQTSPTLLLVPAPASASLSGWFLSRVAFGCVEQVRGAGDVAGLDTTGMNHPPAAGALSR
jgi:hypothetical protein